MTFVARDPRSVIFVARQRYWVQMRLIAADETVRSTRRPSGSRSPRSKSGATGRCKSLRTALEGTVIAMGDNRNDVVHRLFFVMGDEYVNISFEDGQLVDERETREPGGMWSRAACTSRTTRTVRASFVISFASCTQPASHPKSECFTNAGSISSGAHASPAARARRPGFDPASQVPPPCARRSLHQELRCGSGLKQLEEFQYLSGSSWTHAQPAPVRAPAHLPVRSRALAAASPAPRARPRV